MTLVDRLAESLYFPHLSFERTRGSVSGPLVYAVSSNGGQSGWERESPVLKKTHYPRRNEKEDVLNSATGDGARGQRTCGSEHPEWRVSNALFEIIVNVPPHSSRVVQNKPNG